MPEARESDDPARRIAIAVGVFLLIAILGPRPYPAWVGQRLRQAAAAAAGGHPGASLEAISGVLRFEPALAALHLDAARLALQAGVPERAEQHLARAREAGVDGVKMTCLHLDARIALGEVPTGFDKSSAACVLEAANPDAWVAAAIDQGHLEAARRILAVMVLTSPDVVRQWEVLAGLTEILDPASTEAVILQALASHPLGSPLLDRLWKMARQGAADEDPAERAARVGQEFAGANTWPVAIAAWRWATEQEPDFPRARAYLGYGLDLAGEHGFVELSRAASEAPNDPLVRALMGQYWMRHDEPELARRELALARRLEPDDPAISAGLGAALAQVGQYPEAAEAYLTAAQMNPSDPTFWSMLADFSLQHDYQVEVLGLPAARNAAALSSSPAAQASLGFATSLSGQSLLGERLLVRSISQDPWNPSAWYRLGLTLLELGRLADARTALARAVHLDPQGGTGLLAQRTLESLPE